MGRRLELDAARGVMLVWITLTHLPTAASHYVNQPFGFVSAAEGFIFLSALFTGRIYYRLADHDGYRAMTRSFWRLRFWWRCPSPCAATGPACTICSIFIL